MYKHVYIIIAFTIKIPCVVPFINSFTHHNYLENDQEFCFFNRNDNGFRSYIITAKVFSQQKTGLILFLQMKKQTCFKLH